ncbi:MAG TPA: hypothetical protein VFF98_07000, partial [Novosphingobium sp.]|nr:hypothetical protein [Novosphingobium sp.]
MTGKRVTTGRQVAQRKLLRAALMAGLAGLLLAGSAEAAGSARAVGQGPEPLLPPTPPTPRPTPSTAATQKAF